MEGAAGTEYWNIHLFELPPSGVASRVVAGSLDMQSHKDIAYCKLYVLLCYLMNYRSLHLPIESTGADLLLSVLLIYSPKFKNTSFA